MFERLNLFLQIAVIVLQFLDPAGLENYLLILFWSELFDDFFVQFLFHWFYLPACLIGKAIYLFLLIFYTV